MSLESLQLCPVARLNFTQEQDASWIHQDDHLMAVADVSWTATVRISRNPIALVGAAGRNMEPIAETVTARVTAEDTDNEENVLQVAQNKAFSEAVFRQLGSNCLKCRFSNWCGTRATLAEVAHDPTRSY